MNIRTLDIHHGAINVRKMFWLLVMFEIVTLIVVYLGDLIFYNNPMIFAAYVGIIITPILLLVIPLEPTIGILLMMLATGFDFLGIIVKGSGEIKANLTYFHVALFVTLVSVFLNLTLKRRTIIRSTNLWPPLVAFFLVLAFSLIYTPDFMEGGFTFVRIVVLGTICLIVIECVDREWKVKAIIWSMILVPFGVSLLTIYQLLTEGAFYSPRIVKMATSLGLAVFRSTGTFFNPNQLACFLMIGIVVPFGILFVKKLNSFTRVFLVMCLIVTSVGILTSFSRAGWLSSLAALMLIVALHKKWSYFWIFIGIVIIMTIVLTIKIPQLWEVIFDRFESIFSPSGDVSSSSRISLIKTGIWMWQDHPLFGVGLRGFPYYYYDYVDPNMPHILIEVNEPHTIQVEILAEEGLIGFVIATWLFMTVLFHGLRTSLKLKSEFLKNAQIACVALVVGFVVNFTFATDITNNSFWIIVGMIYAIPFVEEFVSSNTAHDAGEGSLPS